MSPIARKCARSPLTYELKPEVMWGKFNRTNTTPRLEEHGAFNPTRPAPMACAVRLRICYVSRASLDLLPNFHCPIKGRRRDNWSESRVRPSNFCD